MINRGKAKIIVFLQDFLNQLALYLGHVFSEVVYDLALGFIQTSLKAIDKCSPAQAICYHLVYVKQSFFYTSTSANNLNMLPPWNKCERQREINRRGIPNF